MKRTHWPVKLFSSFKEQESWEIAAYIGLTPEERQRIARELRERHYGPDTPRLRKSRLGQ
jgi:hypothetical protein